MCGCSTSSHKSSSLTHKSTLGFSMGAFNSLPWWWPLERGWSQLTCQAVSATRLESCHRVLFLTILEHEVAIYGCLNYKISHERRGQPAPLLSPSLILQGHQCHMWSPEQQLLAVAFTLLPVASWPSTPVHVWLLIINTQCFSKNGTLIIFKNTTKGS
jgi:hypothetical protein